jgi:hypothetical protein
MITISPSKFVMFDEDRTVMTENPFYGNTQKQTDNRLIFASRRFILRICPPVMSAVHA